MSGGDALLLPIKRVGLRSWLDEWDPKFLLLLSLVFYGIAVGIALRDGSMPAEGMGSQGSGATLVV